MRSLRMKVGALSGVEAESLRFALEICARGTRAEGAEVVIERLPARGMCRSCRGAWDFEIGDTQCPACGSPEVELHGGDDLRVESFDME